MALTRRRFFQLGLGGTALLAAGGIGLSLSPTILRTPRRALLALDQRSFSILAAVADRISPAGDGLPSAWDLEIPEAVDTLFSKVHPADIKDLVQALMLVENGVAGLLFDGRFGNFTAATGAEQDQTLHGFRTSTLQTRRTVYKVLYGICSAAYWADPSVHAFCGYAGPPDYGNGRGTGPSRPKSQLPTLPPPAEDAQGETP